MAEWPPISHGDVVAQIDLKASRAGGTSPAAAPLPTLNVRDYGAVGDGVADDTASVQAAVDAAQTRGGGHVVFPIGTYKVTSTILLPSQVVLAGTNGGAQVGGPTRIVWAGAAGGTVIGPKVRTGNTVNVGVHGLEVSGNYTAAIVLDLYRTSYSRIIDSLIHRANPAAGVGVMLDGNVAGQCYFNVADNVKVSECPTGVRFKNGANANRWDGGKVGNGGIGMEFLSLSAGNIIAGVDFEDVTIKHVYLDASSNVFVGCHMEAAPLGFDITVNARDTRRFGTTLATNVTTWVTDASIEGGSLDAGNPGVTNLRVGPLRQDVTYLSSGTTVETDPKTATGTGNALYRFFRGVLTTGVRQLVVYVGDGTNTTAVTIDAANSNINLADVGVGGGRRGIGMRDCITAPATNPAGGGFLYSQGGALKYKGSSGAVFNATQQAAVASPAADVASLKAAVDELRARLAAAGLIV